jgi:HAMP domain-containing protein
MTEREFRLPGSPYEELVNIIVAYGTRDEAARTGDVGKLDAAHQSSVSRNNGFLTEIGVLQGESKKLITRRGRALALALARKERAEIRRHWRAIVATNEFLQNVVAAVKLREGMLYPTVQAYVAHAAGQPRNKPVMAGAGAIVEILKAAGLLREEAGELVATFEEEFEPEDLGMENGSLAEVAETSDSEPAISATVDDVADEDPLVRIHLHIQCTADEIEDLAPRLKALLRELSASRSEDRSY